MVDNCEHQWIAYMPECYHMPAGGCHIEVPRQVLQQQLDAIPWQYSGTYAVSSIVFGTKQHWGWPSPVYSLTTCSCIFFLFFDMKTDLHGQLFETVGEIQANVQVVHHNMTKKTGQLCFTSKGDLEGVMGN